jgi:hypothetical protein
LTTRGHADADRLPARASLRLIADPAAGALIGTIVFYGLLVPDAFLVFALIFGLVNGIDKSRGRGDTTPRKSARLRLVDIKETRD